MDCFCVFIRVLGRERVVCGGEGKIFGCRNKNKTGGIFLVCGAFLA